VPVVVVCSSCCVTDVDECTDSEGACHHLCINTEGSYECACNVGYTLLPDHRNCVKGLLISFFATIPSCLLLLTKPCFAFTKLVLCYLVGLRKVFLLDLIVDRHLAFHRID